MIKIDRDLIVSKEECFAQPSIVDRSKKRRRDEFVAGLQDEEQKLLCGVDDSNLSHSKFKKTKEFEEEMDFISNLVIGQCKPANASRRRASNETFVPNSKMLNLKMVAENLKPSKFTIICTLLCDYVRADSNGRRHDFILSDYEVKAAYVEYMLRQILSGTLKGSASACEEDGEILVTNTGYTLM